MAVMCCLSIRAKRIHVWHCLTASHSYATCWKRTEIKRMANTRRMEGQRALVTGSDAGIGRGVALEFAREGAAVALHYPFDGAGAQAAVEQIRHAGGKAE